MRERETPHSYLQNCAASDADSLLSLAFILLSSAKGAFCIPSQPQRGEGDGINSKLLHLSITDGRVRVKEKWLMMTPRTERERHDRLNASAHADLSVLVSLVVHGDGNHRFQPWRRTIGMQRAASQQPWLHAWLLIEKHPSEARQEGKHLNRNQVWTSVHLCEQKHLHRARFGA